MKNKNIVMFGLQPWDIALGSNCKNIAIEFSKNNQVLYINRPIDRASLLKRNKSHITKNRIDVLQKRKAPLQLIAKNLWVLTPPIIMESVQWLSSYVLFQLFNKWNNRKLAKIIKQYTEELGFENMILFNDSAMFQGCYLKELLDPELFIYYIRDYLIAQPYFRKHGPRAEQQIIAKADLVVANSTYLKDYAKKYNKNSHFVGQGCDLSIFFPKESQKLHPLVLQIKGPIIGYVGLLTAKRLDISLLEYIAKCHPEWSIVLVGPEDDIFKKSKLHTYSNVKFMGSQKPEFLPLFIHGFDICINPQVLNDLSRGNYPRKIDEYLAMGKPVVATATNAMELFKDYVHLASSNIEFVEKIELALTETGKEINKERVLFAQSHTWENSVRAIWDAVRNKTAVL